MPQFVANLDSGLLVELLIQLVAAAAVDELGVAGDLRVASQA